MSKRRRDADPVRVAEVVGSMVERGGWRNRLALGKLRGGWESIVGAQIAAHSEPVKLSEGVLTVRAESGVWASELALLSRRVATKSDEWLGGGLVTEVKVSAGRI